MNERVFISSTFQDLEEYRLAVQQGIRQLGLVDISMEHFGARDERPKVECIRIIKGESDFFVGIYAHRYGYIPNDDNISIIQTEYQAASEAKIPKLIYVIDNAFPWPPLLIDDGEPKNKLQEFKKYLYSEHIYKKFTNKDNLTASVVADLGRTISINKSANLVGGNIPLRDIISVSEKVPSNEPIEYWNAKRNKIYDDNRGIFLTHIIKPSTKEGQVFDVSIYLLRHKSDDFSDVRYAEFFLGPYWKNKVFQAKEEVKGFIGISTSAYGTFLCICKVTFQDNSQIEIHRYIDFEAKRMD
jgi:hypothetical protein